MAITESTPSNRQSHVIWQDAGDAPGEPALLIQTYRGSFSITQGDAIININYETVKELCKILKLLQEPK